MKKILQSVKATRLILCILIILFSALFGRFTSEIDVYGMTKSEYDSKIASFINDSKWKNGISWGGEQTPKIAWNGKGCCAYVNDFARYVYGADSQNSGTKYTGVSNIKTGDVLYVYSGTYGEHWIAVLERNGNSLYVAEGNAASKVRISSSEWTISGSGLYNSWSKSSYSLTYGFHYDEITEVSFQGWLDSCTGDTGAIKIRGWAFDHSDKTKSIEVHVYIGGKAGEAEAEGYGIVANASRPDVNDVYPGAGNYHGFDATITTTKTGQQNVYIYMVNPDTNKNSLLGSTSVYINPVVVPTSVSLNKSSATLNSVGQTLSLTATVSPSSATNKNVTWKSSNTAVATVNSSGKVTAVGNGTATITVTTNVSGKTATCNVTVSIAPTGVTLDKTSATLTAKGETLTLKATVSPNEAANKSVTWKSSNTSVATVDSSGKVTAVGNGTATITVTTAVGNKTATCNVTVNIVPTGVTLDKTSATLTTKGETLTLKATVAPNEAANKSVTWKSSNTSVATVDANGKVTAVGNGTATITVTTAVGNKTATCNVTVNITPTGVTLDKTSATLTTKGETLTLKATVAPNEAANKSVTWKSSNTSVATVDANGKVTAVGNGTATITVTTAVGNKTATCNVTVNITPTGVTLDKTSATLTTKGETLTLKATVAPNEAANKSVTWKSSNTSVATVDANGKVTAVGNGTATITVTTTVGGKTATCNITVQIKSDDGLRQDEDGNWYYYVDGKIATNYTGLVEHNGSWFYVEKGVLNWSYTGLTCYNGTWYYVEGGILNWGYTGLTYYNGSWYYVEGGVLNWEYTGLTCYNGTWYYVESGILNWGYTGLTYYNNSWYYVEGGILNWGYTGLTCYNGTWYYVEGGVLNWGYTGLTLYNGSWYYVEGGVLNWGYTGLTCYYGTWYYVEGGILNWNFTGYVEYYGNWYYVENGVMVRIA